MYYNYHAKAKQLISENHLQRFEIVNRWNSISPALVLYFDNHRPMPIREYRWDEYWEILTSENGKIMMKQNENCNI